MKESQASAPSATAVGADQMISMYKTMVRIREFETLVNQLFLAGKVPGFVHLYSGEEAVAVGVMANLRKDDFIASTHRGHGHVIAKGGDVKLMIAELFGRTTGYCKGKGGSMHIADFEQGMLGANGIVGAGIPLATGAAFACKYKGSDSVGVSFFGDGASNRGTFHEALNLAAVWNLPAIYVCENNLYGEWTCQGDAMKLCDIAGRAKSYGMPARVVDGNDVLAVNEAAVEAVERARRGDGPSLIECQTWRHHAHFVGDPGLERDLAEHAEWLKKDPIPRLAQVLVDAGHATDAELEAITSSARAEMAEAVTFAESGPLPTPDDGLTDVYVS